MREEKREESETDEDLRRVLHSSCDFAETGSSQSPSQPAKYEWHQQHERRTANEEQRRAIQTEPFNHLQAPIEAKCKGTTPDGCDLGNYAEKLT